MVSVAASLINLVVGLALLRAGRRHRSMVLEADGQHLITDVWTSVGVVIGVGAVAITGLQILDPVIALAVAANIVVTGGLLVRRAMGGLLDRALGDPERAAVDDALSEFAGESVRFLALRTRPAGRRAFVSLDVLVPGTWTVQQGHDIAERVEGRIRARVPYATVFTHLEPQEDPRSFDDTGLDRGADVETVTQPSNAGRRSA